MLELVNNAQMSSPSESCKAATKTAPRAETAIAVRNQHPTVFSLVRRKKTEVTGTSIAQPWCISVMTGHYDGRELRPFDGRPGAMDAYALPSRGF